ncbi:multicopper oxidase domain-containing protein, partial [Serratia marcescens]|uniref:multicopper oxidase domain-containing protein n=1 Tax=Serratia marcescens TaxID=615 RepID=UPI0013DC52CA
IELASGKVTEILAYNGHLVGPVIEIDEGDQIKISFENRIAGQESTIHWHGLPIPPHQDGNPMDPVASGSSHLYGFTIPAE